MKRMGLVLACLLMITGFANANPVIVAPSPNLNFFADQSGTIIVPAPRVIEVPRIFVPRIFAPRVIFAPNRVFAPNRILPNRFAPRVGFHRGSSFRP